MLDENGRPVATQDQVKAYHRISSELETYYSEINAISRKKPSEVLNKFKINFLNQSLSKANSLLGDEFRPFPDFLTFDVDSSMPTASDAVLVIAHYQKSLGRFKVKHSHTKSYNEQVWNKAKDEEVEDVDDENESITKELEDSLEAARNLLPDEDDENGA